MAKLVLTSGGPTREYKLDGVHTIGRHPHAFIHLDDPEVATYHAMIDQMNDKSPFFVDGGSVRGSTINGERYLSRNLHDGDVIRIGKWTFAYASEGAPERPAHVLPFGTSTFSPPSSRRERATLAPTVTEAGFVETRMDRLLASANVFRAVCDAHRATVYIGGKPKYRDVDGQVDALPFAVQDLVVGQSEAVLIPNLADDQRLVNNDAVVSANIGAVLGFPVHEHGQLRATIVLERRRRDPRDAWTFRTVFLVGSLIADSLA